MMIDEETPLQIPHFVVIIATDMEVNSTVIVYPGVTPAISVSERRFLATILCIIVVTGLFGNSVVMMSVFLSKKLRRCITTFFILNLSVADVAACLSMPWTIVSFLYPGGWPLPDFLCQMGGFGLIMFFGCSVMTLSTIAINRLHLITWTRHTYLTIYTPIKTGFIILATWLLAIMVASVPLIFNFGQLGYSARHASCTRDPSHPLATALNIFLAAVFYPVPCLIIISSYAKIYSFVRSHSRIIKHGHDPTKTSRTRAQIDRAHFRGHISRRQLLVTWNMFYVVCVFCALVSPYAIALFISNNDRALPYTAVVLSFNSCINPFIYATKHPDFKKVMVCILTCRIRNIPGRVRRQRTPAQPLKN
ncbi:melatonin receptor type 1C-like [Acanthaster planci]|uniref:Melatonin receptor type 1C-like n=1 Tax=Acanthaster planci TaxID=133434 RepID=A0A8B7ZDX1_ACAPL|nr:melatonin receptor type 1C-like [Acanthaster planci]